MPKLLEIESAAGPLLFQLPARPGEVAAISKTGDVIDKIGASMGELLGIVSGVAKGFSSAIADSPVETAELEFGLSFTAKGKLYVVETEAQGAIRVQLTVRPGGSPTTTVDER